jgi:hypothetical protein
MSDLSQLEGGKITLQQFIEKVAAEFNASPFKFLVPLLLQLLQVTLAAALRSPTAAALIVADIQSVMSGNTSALAVQADAGSVALVGGLLSGQSGKVTAQQVGDAILATQGATTTTATNSATGTTG